MSVLALDLGNKMGWALKRDDLPVEFGVWRLTQGQAHDPGRFVRLQWHLDTVQSEGDLELLALELPPTLPSRAANATLHGMAAIAQAWAYAADVPWTGIAPSVLKKHGTGNGRANKADMLSAARERWGSHIINSDDEADALWLLDYALVTHCSISA